MDNELDLESLVEKICQGDPEAKIELHQKRGTDSLSEAQKKLIFQSFRIFADDGNDIAQCYMGLYFAEGFAVNQNAQKAVEWYKKSCDQGNLNAMNYLAYHYQTGLGVELDKSKTYSLYFEASQRGNIQATNNLGSLLYERGSDADKKEAVKLWTKAAESGYDIAKGNLERLCSSNTPDAIIKKSEEDDCEISATPMSAQLSIVR